MAPREATGTFPDQFLTFDYDAAIPMGGVGMGGGGPPLHQTVVAATAGAVDPLPLPEGTELDVELNTAGGELLGNAMMAEADALLNHHGSGGHFNSIDAAPSRPSSMTNAANNSLSLVDPLSIDPTVHHHHHHHPAATAAAAVSPHHQQHQQHQQHHHHISAISSQDHSESSSHLSALLSQQRRRVSVESSASSAASSASNDTTTTTASRPSPEGSGSNHSSSRSFVVATPPLSTGSSILHAASPPTSPLSASGSPLPLPPPPQQQQQQLRSLHRRFHLQSVLDSTVSMESEYGGDQQQQSGIQAILNAPSPPPGLERTFDSAASSLVASSVNLNDDDEDNDVEEEEDDDHDDDDDVDLGSDEWMSPSHHRHHRHHRLHHAHHMVTEDDEASPAGAASRPQQPQSQSSFSSSRGGGGGASMTGSSRHPHLLHSPSTTASVEGDEDDDDDDDDDEEEEEDDDNASVDSMRIIYRNVAFDTDDANSNINNNMHHQNHNSAHHHHLQSPLAAASSEDTHEDYDGSHHHHHSHSTPSSSPTGSSIMLSFGPNTTVADLKYFAERGCIVALLQALTTPRLVTLGTRMLADYAKMSHRRVAVASNRKILEFVQRTMLQVGPQSQQPQDQQDHEQRSHDHSHHHSHQNHHHLLQSDTSSNSQQQQYTSPDWLGREYAVETVRSLTATEASDRFLMTSVGLLNTLALVARGGPFVTTAMVDNSSSNSHQQCATTTTVPLASEKARLHACIAIMNLSCGKANKIEIAKIPDVLEAMRDVMLHSESEARLKATTCIKNLSNADANDAALLGTPGLVEALGHTAAVTCLPETGATPCTTNACLALMNLSISKANKHRVFRTPGVMEALMTVLERTTAQGSSTEARIKACSALSNLAIGYDNKIPMFNYPGFVDSILNVIQTDTGEARTKACSILWSFAAEMKNQVPVVQRGDILPVLVRVAEEDGTTEARFKCVAALTLLAESLDNAIPLLEAGALVPLMDILHDAGPDPTQWKGQTASWCVGFLMNIAQSDEAVPSLREAGVVELLAPLLTLDHYQSLKAAMAVTFCCRYDKGDECYDLLRKTENVIPKIISLLHNTLSGRGGNGYKYGVFTLRSSVGCIAALALGPDFMKERVATGPVYESLLRVVTDFCVDGGSPGAIVGGGRDDALSATLAVRALHSLTGHLIPMAGSSALPFGQSMEDRLLLALESFESCPHAEVKPETRDLATDAKIRIQGGRKVVSVGCAGIRDDNDVDMGDVASMASHCCGIDYLSAGFGEEFFHGLMLPSLTKDRSPAASHQYNHHHHHIVSSASIVAHDDNSTGVVESRPAAAVRTFLLADARTGRRFVVPTEPSGGRAFNDTRVWCYRRGRFCGPGEVPDPNYLWTAELQRDYEDVLAGEHDEAPSPNSSSSDTALVAGILQGQ
jgi:hypothetical protein